MISGYHCGALQAHLMMSLCDTEILKYIYLIFSALQSMCSLNVEIRRGANVMLSASYRPPFHRLQTSKLHQQLAKRLSFDCHRSTTFESRVRVP